jgi:hypothetical protein
MFYYLIFISIIICSFYIYFIDRTLETKVYKFFLFTLFFISAFRYQTGNDWYTYELIFKNSLDIKYLITDFSYYMDTMNNIEIGYRILNSIIKSLSGNLQVIFLITSVFSFYALNEFIKKNSSYKLLSLLIYYSIFFMNFNMSIIRQGIAFSLFLLAFDSLLKRKLIKYLSFILLAALFHISSLILVPVYFIYHFKYSRLLYCLLIGLAIFLRILNVKLMLNIGTILQDFLGRDILLYISPEYQVGIFSFGNLERMIVFLIILFLGKNILKKRENISVLFSLYIIYIMLNFLLYESEIVLSRIRFFFQIPYIIILPLFIEAVRENLTKSLVIIYIYVFSFIPLFNFLSSDINKALYNPYQNLIIHKYILHIESDGHERFQKIIDGLK